MPVKVVSNRFKSVKAHTRREVKNRLTLAADGLRIHLEEALNNGTLPISSDTMALATSLSVQTPKGSDLDKRLLRAGAKYLSEEGRWILPVREHVTPDAYEKQHLAARVAPEEPLAGSELQAAVFTVLAWGLWWEMGHKNVFTGQYEHRPWMWPEAQSWATRFMLDYFADLF